MNLALVIPGMLAEIVIVYVYWFSYLEMRYDKRRTIALFVILQLANMIRCLFMLDKVALKGSLTVISEIIMLQILFKDKWSKKLFAQGVYMACTICAEFVAMVFAKYVYNCALDTMEVSLTTFLWQGTAYLFNYIFNISALLMLKNKNVKADSKVTFYISLYVALQCIIVFAFIMFAVDYMDRFFAINLLTTFILGASVVIGILIYRTVRIATAKTIEAEYIRKEAEMKDRHFSEIKEQYGEYKRLRHDFKNHLRILAELKDPAKIAEYTSGVRSEFEKMEQVSFCDNLTLDALLMLKKTEAKQKNIKISYEICDISEIKISDFDLCSVVSNLLDNAIEAAEKTDERTVHMVIDRKVQRLVIIVENSSLLVDMSLKTTKVDNINHGIGLESIKHTAKKYDGDAVCKYTEGKFTTVVSMTIEKITDES